MHLVALLSFGLYCQSSPALASVKTTVSTSRNKPLLSKVFALLWANTKAPIVPKLLSKLNYSVYTLHYNAVFAI